MQPDLETLFLRYVQSGKPRPLAEIFDRTAPELLRLAVHLCGDMGQAEDLVQATFLAAIEQRERFDSSRPLLPWLTGILTKKALAHRRRAGRDAARPLDAVVDGAAIAHEETPLEALAEGELHESVTQAVDRVPEPYRAALVLRLRHGLSPADIAHALGRSSGTVRVQLHRGLEMLRKQLPTGVAGGIAHLFLDSRGLAAVREQVLAHASLAAGVGSTATVVGAAVVSKKIVLVAGIALALALGMRFLPQNSPAQPATELQAEAPELEEPELVRPAQLSVGGEPAETREIAERATGSTTVQGPPVRGQVVDALSGEPIAGARLELHAPWRGTLLELCQEYQDELNLSYGIASASSDIESFLIPKYLSQEVRHGRGEVTAYTPVRGSPMLLTATRTADDGRFEFPLPEKGGELVVSAPGFGTRQLPYPEVRGGPRPSWDHDAGAPITTWEPGLDENGEARIELWPPRLLEGRVIDPEGNPVLEEIDIEFWDTHARTATWIVRTDATGAFRAQLPAGRVQARSPHADYRLESQGVHPERQQPWIFRANWVPGEAEPAWIVLQRGEVLDETPTSVSMQLRLFDAATKEPIEVFQMHLYDGGSPSFLRGVFYAPGGLYQFEDRFGFPYDSARVWAEGYALTEVGFEESSENPVDVALTKGTIPTLEGQVLGGADAQVSFYVRSSYQWDEASGHCDGSVQCDESGRFSVRLAPGSYAVRVDVGASTAWAACAVPHDGRWTLDLSSRSRVEVTVLDSAGNNLVGHPVGIQGADRRGSSINTDETGRAVFDSLAPGATRVYIPYEPTKNSWGADDLRELTLAPGSIETVEFIIPEKTEPLHALLVASGTTDFTGWRARDVYGKNARDWVAVAADGRVPIDVQYGTDGMEIEAPDRRSWIRAVPVSPGPDYVIRLTQGERSFIGVCLDRGTGKPLAGVRVNAGPETKNEGWADAFTACCTTDESGRFRIDGLVDQKYWLTFRKNVERSGEGEPYNHMFFHPAERPSKSPNEIALYLPTFDGENWSGIEQRSLSGRVRMAPGTDVEYDTLVWVTAMFADNDGELWVGGPRGDIGAQGEYEMRIPVAGEYRTAIWLTSVSDSFIEIWPAAADTSDAFKDFVIER